VSSTEVSNTSYFCKRFALVISWKVPKTEEGIVGTLNEYRCHSSTSDSSNTINKIRSTVIAVRRWTQTQSMKVKDSVYLVNFPSTMDRLNDEVTRTELAEWLRSTNVLEDIQRSGSAPEASSSSTQRPKRRDFKRKSSLDHVPSDGKEHKIFGIDAQTALRAARQFGVGLASSRVGKTINPWSSSSSSSSKSKSPSPTSLKQEEAPSQESCLPMTRRPFDRSHHQPVIDLTTAYEPLTCAPVGAPPTMLSDIQVDFAKRARMSFEEDGSVQTSLADQTSSFSSFVAATHHLERTQRCPKTRRSSLEFMTKWQKLRQQGPRRTSLPESVPSISSHESSLPTSFFCKSSTAEFHDGAMDISDTSKTIDCSDSTKMSSSGGGGGYFDELQIAMEQTQQSRRMILDAWLDLSNRSDINNNDVASSNADVGSTAEMMEEFGMQCMAVGMDAPPPQPLPTLADTARTASRVKVTAAEAEAKRILESIAREQMILEKRLTELQREGSR